VLTARTGPEALAVAASHPPDAVILDLGLPDIDGTEVIVELRRWSRAPIIVLSGRSSPGDKIGALDVGADDWRILEILLQRPGQLVGSAQILTGVWGPGFSQRTNYLRFHMARPRRKLEDNPARPRHLLTEPGMGYRYQP
jgi:two-component system KDP operon response regulator KdpE